LAAEGFDAARLVESHAGGLLLLEELQGASRVVIVDALLDGRRAPGEVVLAGLDDTSCNISCSHDCSLAETLELGRSLGYQLPDDGNIDVVAVVVKDVTTFGERLSLEVAAAIPVACAAVRGCFALKPEPV
jgi:hydrogenase maturation protease